MAGLPDAARIAIAVGMDLDSLLHHYFGTADLDGLDDATLDEGHRRVTLAFAVERDSGRRFALWIILHTLGDAPPPEKAFKNPAERRAAEDFARAADRLDQEPDPDEA